MLSFLLGFLEANGCTVTAGGQTFDLSELASEGSGGVIEVQPDTAEKSLYKYQISICDNKASCQGNTGCMIRERDSAVATCLGIYGQWGNAQNPAPTVTADGF